MFACNGILFNHESPVRGETFVTRKITMGISRVALGLEKNLILGNLDAKRDWGHARDYVEAMWKMLQQKKPDDYVISTGNQYSVREFIYACAERLEIQIYSKGKGVKEKLYVKSYNASLTPGLRKGKVLVKISPNYFRPSEVESLLGDSSKAQKFLKWKNKTSFQSLVDEMVDADFKRAKSYKLLEDFNE
jgi:GDPmannose 4,6-dehydratase